MATWLDELKKEKQEKESQTLTDEQTKQNELEAKRNYYFDNKQQVDEFFNRLKDYINELNAYLPKRQVKIKSSFDYQLLIYESIDKSILIEPEEGQLQAVFTDSSSEEYKYGYKTIKFDDFNKSEIEDWVKWLLYFSSNPPVKLSSKQDLKDAKILKIICLVVATIILIIAIVVVIILGIGFLMAIS